jgi:transposase
MKTRRIFDETFKVMAVELSYAKGSVQEAARELGIDSGRITKWRQSCKSPGQSPNARLSEEQKQIRQLQKELKEVQLERDILKSQ